MNTLTINSKAALTLARAAEKARNEKPLVKKTETYGVYEVRSSDKTRWYTVKCNSANKTITCNCKAAKPCYHIAAVAPLHSYIARQKQEAEKASQGEEPVQPICGCGNAAYAHFNGEWKCIDCVKKLAEAEKQAQFEKDYADLIPSFDDDFKPSPLVRPIEYTAAQADKDRSDLFG